MRDPMPRHRERTARADFAHAKQNRAIREKNREMTLCVTEDHVTEAARSCPSRLTVGVRAAFELHSSRPGVPSQASENLTVFNSAVLDGRSDWRSSPPAEKVRGFYRRVGGKSRPAATKSQPASHFFEAFTLSSNGDCSGECKKMAARASGALKPPDQRIFRRRLRRRQAAGIRLTWAAAIRQPSSVRSHTWLCRPVMREPGRWNSVLAVAMSRP